MDSFNNALKLVQEEVKDISSTLHHIYKQVPASYIPYGLKEANENLIILHEHISKNPKEPNFPSIKINHKRSRTLANTPAITNKSNTNNRILATREKFQLFSTSHNFSRLHSKQSYQRPKFSRMSNARVIPKATRYDPLANPIFISQEEHELGLFSLSNKGIVSKNADLEELFELPVLNSKKIQLNTFSSQFQSPICDKRIFQTSVDNSIRRKRIEVESPDMIKIGDIDSPSNKKKKEKVKNTIERHFLIVKKGKIKQNLDFDSFRRAYYKKWRTMEEVLRQVEEFCKKFRYLKVVIDARKLYELEIDEVKPLTIEKFRTCVINLHEIKETLISHKVVYRGEVGRHLAAVKIQTAFRRFYGHRQYRHLRALNIRAKIIQLYFRLYLKKLETKRNIEQVRQDRKEKFRQRQKQFKIDWPNIKNTYRTEIHLGSIQPDITKNFYYAKQNIQLMRVFSLCDPKLSIIYISPIVLHSDILEYYYSVLKLCEIPNAKDRLVFITPNHGINLDSLYSTSKLLFLSSGTINEIKEMIKGKIAYLVPNVPNEDDIWLSDLLGIPVMCTEPGLASQISTKIGCTPIFKNVGIKLPLQITGIKTPEFFYQTLSNLIFEHLHKDIWMFKLNHETSSRGLAYFDTTKLKSVLKYRKYDTMKEEFLTEIHAELIKIMPHSVKLVMMPLWESWDSYLQVFCTYGGIIQETPDSRSNIASPCISICIEPDGGIRYICAVDRMQSREYLNLGIFFPQSSFPHSEILEIGYKVGKELYSQGVLGYANIEFVAFPDPYNQGGLPVYWGIDIRLNFGVIASSYFMFHVLVGGFLENASGKYYIEFEEQEDEFNIIEDVFGDNFTNLLTTSNPSRSRNEYTRCKLIKEDVDKYERNVEDFNKFDERCYLFCWHVEHPDLRDLSIGGLFHMCRLESMTYSLETCKGSMFSIYEKLSSHHFGIMGIGNNRQDSIRVLSETFSFILQQAGPPPQPPTSFKMPKKEDYNLNELITKVKSIHKTLEKINKSGKKNYLVELL
ncbi:hypothetical protein SteCoe_1483 [Stentor coeruleus]|uniref:IQCH-like ATP-grasp domain-containing protein n=1 Tax=Stentor coeruleus TaxID=5963 RepID=A0A1R2D1X1_9CILI|nr:hypothetical protein SteCoe_1483 [Stentor coeruleus]